MKLLIYLLMIYRMEMSLAQNKRYKMVVLKWKEYARQRQYDNLR
jgi:hypothetical protein